MNRREQVVLILNHPLGQVDIMEVPAYHRIGMEEDFEEIDMSGGVEEIKSAIL